MPSIYRNSNGRFTGQVNIGGVRRSKTFDTKTEAKRWASREEAGRDTGKITPATGVTLGHMICEHKAHAGAMGRSKSTQLDMINRMIGRVPLSKVTARTFIEFINERKAQPTAPQAPTLGQDLIFIATALKYGGAIAGIDTSSAIAALGQARMILSRSGSVSRPGERSRRPTHAELKRLEAYMTATPRREGTWPLVQFLIGTALRLGEACNLTYDDINFDDRTMLIRARKHPNPSVKRSNDQVVPIMRGHFIYDGAVVDPLDIARRGYKSGPLFGRKADSFSNFFTRAVKACSIDDLHCHDLRHEGVSLLAEAGLDIMRIAAISGHRDINMLKRYTNLQPRDIAHEDLS